MPEVLTFNGQVLLSPDGKPLLAPSTDNITMGIIYNTVNSNGEPIVATIKGKKVSDNAFYNSSTLLSAIIEDGISTIGTHAFSSCPALTSVIIPITVTNILDGAFGGCNLLSNVYYAGSQAQWNSIRISLNNSPLINATIHYNWRDE